MNKNILILCGAIAIVGCSSAPKTVAQDVEVQPDAVLARIDHLSERPDWLTESEMFRIENGMVLTIGKATISADQNVEMAYRIAENNAKSAIAKSIESRMSFVFQNAEEGLSVDANQARWIGAEAVDEIKTSSIRPHKRYWEKYRTSTDSGGRVTKVDVYSVVSMPENDFKQAIMDAIRKRQGKGGLSADFAQKVDQHWNDFTHSNKAENREPAAK